MFSFFAAGHLEGCSLMDAAPSPMGVAAASPTPPPEWAKETRWVSPPADLSIRLPSDPAPAWSRPAQGAAASLLLLAVGLLAWHGYGAQRWSCRPAILEADTLDTPSLDLNQADHAQLLQLPGVGENLARRIEAYRTQHRGFRDVDELRGVSGIGPAMLEKLRPFVYVEPIQRDEDDDAKRPAVREARNESPHPPASKKKTARTQAIDINRASGAELQLLPGIGPKLSQRILDARDKKPFRSVDDLRRVPGIGPKTMERLRPHVVVEE
jgi:competence protein ComEA